jgi:aryl sulfotransferase
MSLHNHFLGFRPEIRARFAEAAKEVPGTRSAQADQTTEDPREFYLGWIAEAEADLPEGLGVDVPFFEFENTYWRERHRPNLLFVHYNDLKADLDGEMRRIARFLDIEVPEAVMPELVQAAKFESMKRDGAALMPIAEAAWDHGADRFLHKGTNGRWQSCLTADDLERYEVQAKRKWSPAHDAWIRHGRLQAGDPRDLPD